MEVTKLPRRTDGGAGRQQELDEVISQLRLRTNKPEKRLIAVVCSSHGLGFDVIFERTDPRQLFKIARIEKHSNAAAAATTNLPALKSASAASIASFDAKEFDNSGFVCPWCRNTKSRVFHKECATYYCGASRHTAADGTHLFTCPSCRETLVCNVVVTSVHGQIAPRPENSLSTKALAQQARKLLPRWPKK
ncbi:hypothetical protein [Rhizobium ruizarguesonis]|uniref:hypothetical protein n=1 Tax=Rhizobium ruizarguesonis TaxID=2081791 RepID=UPI00102FFCC8|nr:hypothetical protein [Rhizobium ruizarguesonis]MBY5891496.1 hypothetical protein [Rhizobium leguminosarum]QSZ04581.1 hypothetical protein J3P73_28705 [Rhizobium ruizarguesonis]TBA11053.1 hypothetical protein ELH65_31830 [Rhizobium ruizarguesonis]